ncbi:hypothetical protein TUBRATIS_25900 [Tubulinosema ratisbonensis]|uniref:Uncharacterized protein n=1 Tax=Tubulinosema ratisbonensis TaxID=291195 RepID=A0A437AIR7_9MICR|nr:hypothetical protein TUBRATIS_25900 [Tubulinosema ratisbonensis]
MDSEKKAKKIISYLNIPFDLVEKFSDQLIALESCLNTESKETCFLIPNEPNQQLPEVFLRTKLLDETECFINNNFIEEKDNWNDCIDEMITKWESFELFEPEEDNFIKKEENLEDLKELITERE